MVIIVRFPSGQDLLYRSWADVLDMLGRWAGSVRIELPHAAAWATAVVVCA